MSRRGQGDFEEIGILGGRVAWQPPYATPAPSPSAVREDRARGMGTEEISGDGSPVEGGDGVGLRG